MLGKITIKDYTITKDDASFVVNGIPLIRFTNTGQSRIWLDERIVIEPGEAYVEGDVNGPGIDHEYKIVFINNPNAPAVDVPKVYAGDRCHVRKFSRQK